MSESLFPQKLITALKVMAGVAWMPPSFYRSVNDLSESYDIPRHLVKEACVVLKDQGYLTVKEGPLGGYALNHGVLNRSMTRLCDDLGYEIIDARSVHFDDPVEQFKESLYILFRRTTISYVLQRNGLKEDAYEDTIFGRDLPETLHGEDP